MHLTNYSINKMNDGKYVHSGTQSILEENNATKRTLTSLWASLSKKGIDVAKIKKNIAETCSRTIEMYGPLIDQVFSERLDMKSATGVPFHILGFDVLIDSALKCWLLEINHSPSMNIYFDNSKNPLEEIEFTDADICPVDFHVKT